MILRQRSESFWITSWKLFMKFWTMKIFFAQVINAVLIKAENNLITLGVASMSCEEESRFHCFLWVDKITCGRLRLWKLWIFSYLVLNMAPISLPVTLKLRKLCSNNSKRLQQFVLILEPAKYGVIYSQKVTLCCRCCRQSWLYWDFRRFDIIILILLLIFSAKNWNTCTEMLSKALLWQFSRFFQPFSIFIQCGHHPKELANHHFPNSSCRMLHSLSSKSNSPFLTFASGSNIMLSKGLFR